MHSFLIVTKTEIAEGDLEQFVLDCQGEWLDQSKYDLPPVGVLTKEGSKIYVSHFDAGENYSEKALELLRKKLGNNPASGVQVEIGHGKLSRDLAYEFVSKVIDKWGGFLDENYEEIQ